MESAGKRTAIDFIGKTQAVVGWKKTNERASLEHNR